jgi:hypothetical protein
VGSSPEVEDDTIAQIFDDLRYPGSKQLRRPAPVRDEVPTWDSKPIKKMYRGAETEFFLPIALATALGKSPITIRLWERKGYIPTAPFRLPGYTDPKGTFHLGKRVYTRPLIEAAIDEFGKRELLGTSRVEWKNHSDLTIALTERWTSITAN